MTEWLCVRKSDWFCFGKETFLLGVSIWAKYFSAVESSRKSNIWLSNNNFFSCFDPGTSTMWGSQEVFIIFFKMLFSCEHITSKSMYWCLDAYSVWRWGQSRFIQFDSDHLHICISKFPHLLIANTLWGCPPVFRNHLLSLIVCSVKRSRNGFSFRAIPKNEMLLLWMRVFFFVFVFLTFLKSVFEPLSVFVASAGHNLMVFCASGKSIHC